MLDIRLVWLLTFLKIIIPSQEMLLKVMGNNTDYTSPD